MTNAQYRKLIGEMGDLFCRFKEEEAREGRTEPEVLDKPQTPKRVWECLYPDDDSIYPECGISTKRKSSNGTPMGWHSKCWDSYQIKTLRGMIEKLRDSMSTGIEAENDAWEQTGVELAELYPERNDEG